MPNKNIDAQVLHCYTLKTSIAPLFRFGLDNVDDDVGQVRDVNGGNDIEARAVDGELGGRL